MRGAETFLLRGLPLHPDATHDKRLPQPDTSLHMKVARFSPHSCSSAPVWMCIGVPLAPCAYSVWGDGACCKGKRCRYSCACVKTWRVMLPEIKSIYQSAAAYHRIITKELGLLSDLVCEREWAWMNMYGVSFSGQNQRICAFLGKRKELSGAQDTVPGFNTHTHTHNQKPWSSVNQQNAGFGYRCSTTPASLHRLLWYKKGCVCFCVCVKVMNPR